MSVYHTLSSDTHLFAAALLQRPVTVVQRTADDIYVIIDDGELIERFSADDVTVGGTVYLRDECEFFVR